MAKQQFLKQSFIPSSVQHIFRPVNSSFLLHVIVHCTLLTGADLGFQKGGANKALTYIMPPQLQI